MQQILRAANASRVINLRCYFRVQVSGLGVVEEVKP